MVDTRRGGAKVVVKKEGVPASKKKKEEPKEIISNQINRKRKETEESSLTGEVGEQTLESEENAKKSSSPLPKKAKKSVKFADKGDEDVEVSQEGNETETTVPVDPPPQNVGENLDVDPGKENVDTEKKEEKNSEKRDVSIPYRRKKQLSKKTKKNDGVPMKNVSSVAPEKTQTVPCDEDSENDPVVDHAALLIAMASSSSDIARGSEQLRESTGSEEKGEVEGGQKESNGDDLEEEEEEEPALNAEVGISEGSNSEKNMEDDPEKGDDAAASTDQEEDVDDDVGQEEEKEEEEIEEEEKEEEEQDPQKDSEGVEEDEEGEQDGGSQFIVSMRNQSRSNQRHVDNFEEDGPVPEAIKPLGMYFSTKHYQAQVRLGTRCHIVEAVETIMGLKPSLTNSEKKWFLEHPQFKHLFHMPKEKTHKVQGMWMLFLRNAKIEKEKEVWFIVNGVPIRYGLREHALISGLNCENYPIGYKDFGGKALVERQFKGSKIRMEDVKARLTSMGPSRDRLKVAVLYLLSSVICAQTKVGEGAKPVLDFFQRAADDLDYCKSFPWGRFSYDYMVKSIAAAMVHFGGETKEGSLWPVPGFCIPMEMLAFEAIEKLGERFREAVPGADPQCPRMCKFKFKACDMSGFPLSKINEALAEEKAIESIIPTISDEEEALLKAIMQEEEDDEDKFDLAVDSWMKRLEKGKTVFFEDMYQEDVAARVVKDKVALPVIEGSSSVDLGELLKSFNKLGKEFKKLVTKVDKFEKRLHPVEAFIKESGKVKRKGKE